MSPGGTRTARAGVTAARAARFAGRRYFFALAISMPFSIANM